MGVSRRGLPVPPVQHIARTILVLRGRRVLLDADLAALYGVPTKRLNEQVRRNASRFPSDFMFQLTEDEHQALRSHFATSKTPAGRGGRRYLPYAFTEHGAIMAATVLNSPRAVEVSVYVVRAFVQLRELLGSSRELARRFEQLEARLRQERRGDRRHPLGHPRAHAPAGTQAPRRRIHRRYRCEGVNADSQLSGARWSW
jgi:hypothetical protein